MKKIAAIFVMILAFCTLCVPLAFSESLLNLNSDDSENLGELSEAESNAAMPIETIDQFVSALKTGGTYKLTKDIDVDDEWIKKNAPISVPSNVNVVIDMNQKYVTIKLKDAATIDKKFHSG